MILAGGSGVRLWPMSRKNLPKQLIPFIDGKTLLEVAVERLEGLVEPERQYICAGLSHRDILLRVLHGWPGEQFLGEPLGRDTLNAVGFSSAVIARRDPDAVLAVFTADHIITPVDEFQRVVSGGYGLVEKHPETLVTFGIAPTGASTGYGYLELADVFDGEARLLRRFHEKPAQATAESYFSAGPSRYLWNSGMFVWRVSTLLDCIRRYEPETHTLLMEIAGAWDTSARQEVLEAMYPRLKKISIDYAVMEPASRDPRVNVAAIPMSLNWLDVGSWTTYAKVCRTDVNGNAPAAPKTLLRDARGNLVVSSDPHHLVAVLGCQDLIVVHTENATLVCHASQAEAVKQLHQEAGEKFGEDYL